jgi:hypothetical protein
MRCQNRKISPLCTSVPLLETGLAEGRAMVERTFAAANDPAAPMAAAPAPLPAA